jgi:hypothetical protein
VNSEKQKSENFNFINNHHTGHSKVFPPLVPVLPLDLVVEFLLSALGFLAEAALQLDVSVWLFI